MTSGLSEEAFLRAIACDLVERHGVEIVILYGSRARGDAQPTSDWDLVGLRDGPMLHEARIVDGAMIDAFVEPMPVAIAPAHLRFLGGRVVIDRDGIGAELLARIAEFERAGPPPLDAIARETERLWLRKMVSRARAGDLDPRDLEAHRRRAELLAQILEADARLRGRWYRGGRAAIAWLASNEPETHALFARAVVPGAPIAAIEALVERVARD